MASDDFNDYDMPPPHPAHHSIFGYSLPISLSALFWLWMCYDAYKRYGGLASWHYFMFFFPPSCVLYLFTHLGQIVGSAPSSGKGLFGLSLKAKITRAQQQLRIADTVSVRAELGELFFDNMQFEESEQEFQKVLVFDPKNAEALYYIGQCRMKRNDFQGALEFLTQVMEREKKLRFGKAWLCFTDCLLAVGKRDEALEERRKLSRAYPRPLTEYAYAELLATCGQKDKAREILDEMLATSHQAPGEDRVWLKRGKTLLRSVA